MKLRVNQWSKDHWVVINESKGCPLCQHVGAGYSTAVWAFPSIWAGSSAMVWRGQYTMLSLLTVLRAGVERDGKSGVVLKDVNGDNLRMLRA